MNNENKEKYDAMLKLLIKAMAKVEPTKDAFESRIAECISTLLTTLIDLDQPVDLIITELSLKVSIIVAETNSMIRDLKSNNPTGKTNNGEYNVEEF